MQYPDKVVDFFNHAIAHYWLVVTAMMLTYIIILLNLQMALSEMKTVVVAAKQHEVQGKCVMYGICGSSNNLDLNCKVDHPPKPLKNGTDLAKLKTYCPELISEFGSDLQVCILINITQNE